MYLVGKVKHLGQTETIGNNGFQKRELVLLTEEQYPQSVLIEFHHDNVDLIDRLEQSRIYKVHFSVRGREWKNDQGETKYFNTLVGWKIE